MDLIFYLIFVSYIIILSIIITILNIQVYFSDFVEGKSLDFRRCGLIGHTLISNGTISGCLI